MDTALVKRSGKVAFFGVLQQDGGYKFCRMTHFTDMATSKNAQEYSRKYVDEDFERSDITGYSPSIAYSFDLCMGNPVHDDMVGISDDEMTGDDAVRPIVVVDMFKTENNAIVRDFAVIPDTEGDSMDNYTYSGNLKVRGEKVFGTATSADDWQTITVD